jgi:hypothetical protein
LGVLMVVIYGLLLWVLRDLWMKSVYL